MEARADGLANREYHGSGQVRVYIVAPFGQRGRPALTVMNPTGVTAHEFVKLFRCRTGTSRATPFFPLESNCNVGYVSQDTREPKDQNI